MFDDDDDDDDEEEEVVPKQKINATKKICMVLWCNNMGNHDANFTKKQNIRYNINPSLNFFIF